MEVVKKTKTPKLGEARFPGTKIKGPKVDSQPILDN